MAGGFVSSPTALSENSDSKNYTFPLIVLTTLFFMWGFITCMNDILVPYFKGVLNLSTTQSSLVQFAFFGAYFIISLIYFLISTNLGDPLAKIGYKNGVIIGLLTAAAGCCLFYPAAELKVFGLFLVALFILASGITILQMAANPYVALLGKSDSASSRLNLTQAFNSFGTTIAPIVGGKLIFAAIGGQEHMTIDSVKIPYLFLAGTLVVLSVIIGMAKLPKFTGEKIEKGVGVFKYPHLVLGVIGIFMYVGGEVSIGTFLIDYFGELLKMPHAVAAGFVAYYWGGAMVGRFIGATALTDRSLNQKIALSSTIALIAMVAVYFVTDGDLSMTFIVLGLIVGNCIAFTIGKSSPPRTLWIFSLIVVGLLVTTFITTGFIALWTVVAIGLFNSIMFPTIFTLAIKDLGKYTSQGSSLLVMAIVGGAIMPVVMAFLIGKFGYQNSMLFPIICYLYILYYGISGYKIKSIPG
jgi:MFS transporter, FHS family, L-fucose permease